MKRLLFVVLTLVTFGAFADNWYSQVLPSATLTATTVNSVDIHNPSWKGADIIVNVSAYTLGTYTPHVQGKDPVSGNYYDILVGSAIGAAGVTTLHVYPGIAATANVAASAILPTTWRVQLVGATPNMTLSVGANLEQ